MHPAFASRARSRACQAAAGKDTLLLRAEALLAKFPKGKVPYRPKQAGWKPD